MTPFVVVLGIAQDGGHPQTGCRRPCCAAAWADAGRRHRVSCLGVVDPARGQRWLIDATPDLPAQLHALDALVPNITSPAPDGVLLTHAHMGHYTGLMHLGREGLCAEAVPVYAMPRMTQLITTGAPWEQLVRLGHMAPRLLEPARRVELAPGLGIEPFLVPHRGEYSETVGFRVRGPRHSVAFLPDIDAWEPWGGLTDLLASVDRAYLDGTFYAAGELPSRDPELVPHPLIGETLTRLAHLPAAERAKVRFLHLNHTNPALDPTSEASHHIEAAGCGVAREGERFDLG